MTDEGITWDCGRCGTINPLQSNACDVCGAPFSATILPPDADRPVRDPGMAALLSLFCPGAGHAYLGLWPQAAARAIVSLWVIATILLTASGAGAGSTVIAGVFAVAGFAFWIAAAHDALREATLDEDAVLLKGRTFVYVVLALLLLLMASLVVSGLRSGVAVS